MSQRAIQHQNYQSINSQQNTRVQLSNNNMNSMGLQNKQMIGASPNGNININANNINTNNQSGSQSHIQSQPLPQTQQQKKNVHKHNHPPKSMKKSWLNPSFIAANILIYIFGFVFIYEFIVIAKPAFWLPVLIVCCVLLFLTLWCYYATVCSSPGNPPFYYGLSNQISRATTRKYCSLCHNFKPQRTHHCSSCQNCILNMDHHCPWVNNCIGFKNRKYFILFLIYITIGLIFTAVIQIIVMVSQIKNAVDTKNTDFHFVLKSITLLITLGLAFALVSFTFFHIKMILNNTTTLEGIISRKGGPQSQPIQNYNVGACQNLHQVFGQNCIYWPLPIKGNGPKGNGTLWLKPQKYYTRQDEKFPIYNKY